MSLCPLGCSIRGGPVSSFLGHDQCCSAVVTRRGREKPGCSGQKQRGKRGRPRRGAKKASSEDLVEKENQVRDSSNGETERSLAFAPRPTLRSNRRAAFPPSSYEGPPWLARILQPAAATAAGGASLPLIPEQIHIKLKQLVVKCRPLEMDKMWSTWNTLLLKTSGEETLSSSSSHSNSEESLPPFGSSRSPSPQEDSIPPDRIRIYRLFCQKEKHQVERQYPGLSEKELKRRLREAWDKMPPEDKNAYLLNFAPPPEKPLPPDEEEPCPAQGCLLRLAPSADRQFIMKHWFKEHAVSQLHVLYTSSLWKRRVPQITPPLPFKEEEETSRHPSSPSPSTSELDSEEGHHLNGRDVKSVLKMGSDKKELGSHCDYQPGDLVWARVGSSNFWPSVVTLDPESFNSHQAEDMIPMEVEDEFAESSVKDSLVVSLENGRYHRCETRRGFKFVEFHVDFFGCVQRAWVSARQMIPFTGIEDFQKYLKAYKKVYKGNFHKSNKEKWDIAVRDAQSSSCMTRMERIMRLKYLRSNDYLALDISRKRKRKSIEGEPSRLSEHPSKKIKICTSSEVMSAIPPSILKNQKKKLRTGEKLFRVANKSNVKNEYPGIKEPEISHILSVLWKGLSPTEQKVYQDEAQRILEMKEEETFNPLPPPPTPLATDSLRDESKRKGPMKRIQPSSSSSSPKTTASSSKPEMVGLFKNERFCIICEEVSLRQKDLITCSGSCGYSFHKTCVKKSPEEVDEATSSAEFPSTWKCEDCSNNISRCFICGNVSLETENEKDNEDSSSECLIKCSHKSCSKYYHSSCLASSSLWPQAVFNPKQASLICPAHMCHTCASDNISNPVMKYSSRLLKCVRCPTSYHSGDYCVTAGSIQITSTAIVCPKHTSDSSWSTPKSLKNKKVTSKHVNVSWCFICSLGGSLICCDLCPASFHSECLDLGDLPEGKYYCQTCCSGRMPLYREVIWVKLGHYRWWPAVVVHPSELPENVNRLNHQMGNFPVKFCGSKEYAWVTHGRTFLYEKGDSDNMPGGSLQPSKKSLTECFRKGLVEAAELFQEYSQAKMEREAKICSKKPPLYQKIKTNRPYGDVSVYTDGSSSEVQICNCDHNSANPCHEDSDCINRMLMVECQMSTCPARDRCQNMQFQRRSYPPLRVGLTESRGWGLFVDKPMKKGRFIIEYVGELITMEEFRNRLRKSEKAKEDENFYYMTMDSSRMIDAGPKGNIARFMNHSCDPNCETQKWTVNGDTRVGIFTLKDIPSGAELTFNYQFEAVGEVKKTCLCGASNCSGYIGKKPASLKQSQSEVASRPGKKRSKKTKFIKSWEDVCFRCYKGGEVLMCDHKTCPKVYHLKCLSRDKMPHGRWFCPWHHCVECGKSAVNYCVHCPNAYCRSHESTLVAHPVLKNLCNEHDKEDIDSLLEYYKSEDGSARKMLTSPLVAPMLKKPIRQSASSNKRKVAALPSTSTSIKKKNSPSEDSSSGDSSTSSSSSSTSVIGEPQEPPPLPQPPPSRVPKGELEIKTELPTIEP